MPLRLGLDFTWDKTIKEAQEDNNQDLYEGFKNHNLFVVLYFLQQTKPKTYIHRPTQSGRLRK